MRSKEETYEGMERRSRMSTGSRVVLAIASLLLLSVYFFPIWKISLEAPQYPEGLGMYIEVDDIRGASPGNLESINGLNHYIGMKEIHPDSIPELKIMPWLFGGLILLGLLAAASGRKGILYTWVGLFLVLAVVGLVDFYLWEYDYGHNLDQERAIIKVPGMTYQPPLIGRKTMLNITAVSLPALGGMLTVVSLLMGMGAAAWEKRRSMRLTKAPVLAAMVFGAALMAGCSTGPRPIAYGDDVCHHCKMTASDARFGAEFVNEHGKVFVFDAIECLAAFVASNEVAAGTAYVTAITAPGALISVEDAFFARSESIMSPMGAHLGAFDSAQARDSFLDESGGEALDWEDVIEIGARGHPVGSDDGMAAIP
ncbi:MAG: nitrous oxide reductase accessory protein NosL [Rhodothermales bacterium]